MAIFESLDLKAWQSACCAYNDALKANPKVHGLKATYRKDVLLIWGPVDPLPRVDTARLTRFVSQKPELHGLAKWAYCDLPVSIRDRSPPFLKRDELSKLMTFKLQIGKWRPRLQQFVDGLDEGEVKQASLKAFAFAGAGKYKEAINALCVLKGVGPATATLILSVYDPSYPFMSDECLEEVLGSRDYTLDEALRLYTELGKKAKELNHLEHARTSAPRGAADVGRTVDTGAPGAHDVPAADVTLPAVPVISPWTANRVQMAIVGVVRASKGMVSPTASNGSGEAVCDGGVAGPANRSGTAAGQGTAEGCAGAGEASMAYGSSSGGAGSSSSAGAQAGKGKAKARGRQEDTEEASGSWAAGSAAAGGPGAAGRAMGMASPTKASRKA